MSALPANLIASADEIDNRLGPLSGRSSDRIAVELREAAAIILRARETVAASMLLCGLATGHGDTMESLLSEMVWQVERLQNRASGRAEP